jgi:hypothetical protein
MLATTGTLEEDAMARPWVAGGGPDEETLRRLVSEGKTNQQIAEIFGATDESSARYWLDKHKIARSRAVRIDHFRTGAVPWRLEAVHSNDPIARLLRQRDRWLHGEDVLPSTIAAIKLMEKDLAETGRVFDYDPAAGFVSRRRDPSIDAPDAIVRAPQDQAANA